MISAFTIIKNEVEWVGYSIMSILDYIDEIVYADGNSTDGTIELIEHIKDKYDKDNKIKLYKNKDCKNLKGDYTRLFNWTLNQCNGDYVMFWHPDMIMINPEKLKDIDGGLRYYINMISFIDDKKHYFKKGRNNRWAIIYRNAFGLHQYGDYGGINEDFYFKDITGDEHTIYVISPKLPYQIKDSGLTAYHYCESKDYNRRLDKMIKTLKNNNPNMSKEEILERAKEHPRVTLKSGKWRGIDFKIKEFKGKQPEVFNKFKGEKWKS